MPKPMVPIISAAQAAVPLPWQWSYPPLSGTIVDPLEMSQWSYETDTGAKEAALIMR